MGKKSFLGLVVCCSLMLSVACSSNNSNTVKPTSDNQGKLITRPSPTLKPSPTPSSDSKISNAKCAQPVKKAILEAYQATSQIKIKKRGSKIYKVGNYEMVDIVLEKSKTEVDKMMSAHFAKDLIDFELFRANILYLNNKFCSLASDFPSGYEISAASSFEEVAGGPYMTAVEVYTTPGTPYNNKLLISLSCETGKWIVVAEEGFKYHKDMYNQIFGKSKLSSNQTSNNVNLKNDNKYLEGIWTRQSNGDSTLEISDVKETEFKFSLLSVNSSGNTGDLSGVAKISGNKAYYKIDSINAEVIFNISEKYIDIEGKGDINANNGMGVTFEGKYIKK